MSVIEELCPRAPAWSVDWPAITERFDWAQALCGCEQDPVYHSEGDVGTHTRMVCEALVSLPEFRGFDRQSQQILFWAAALHDAGKPARTKRQENGRITTRGHGGVGERIARRFLWNLGVDFEAREQIARLVRYHQAPVYAFEDADPRARLYRLSWRLRCDFLAMVAGADARGRQCQREQDQREWLDNVALFRELCVEHECLDKPRRFASAHARFVYFQRGGRNPDHAAYDDTRCEVVLLSGLPAAGKDTWAKANAGDRPILSLDDLRNQLGIAPEAKQGRVADEARTRARVFLREGRGFIWNATNLTRSRREKLIALFADYRARTRIVYVEAPEEVIRRRNRERERPVPDGVLNRMMARWTVPDETEAHAVEHVLVE